MAQIRKAITLADYKTLLQGVKKKRGNPEHQLQAACIAWYDKNVKDIITFAIPNGGKRSKKVAQEMKEEGVRKGVFDLFMVYANHGYNGLFIEMKTPTGTLSKDQKSFMLYCQRHNYKCVVAKTIEQFQHEIRAYLTPNK